VESLKSFEEELLRFLRDSKGDLMGEVEEKKALDEDLKGRLNAAIEEFKKTFAA
jgi:F-type H+-transporting ATPase subunit alpha